MGLWRPGGLRPPGDGVRAVRSTAGGIGVVFEPAWFFLVSPASLGDSVLCPLFFGRDYTSLRRRKEAWFGAPVQRRALAHLVLLIFDAAPGAGYLALCIK